MSVSALDPETCTDVAILPSVAASAMSGDKSTGPTAVTAAEFTFAVFNLRFLYFSFVRDSFVERLYAKEVERVSERERN